MSWINDVKYELDKTDSSKKSLRKFGLTVGIVILTITIWLFFQYSYTVILVLLALISTLLILSGLLKPQILRNSFKYWMGFAFVLGWFVSRFLLTILFIFVLSPIALIAKFFRKDFLNLRKRKERVSYWINKDLESGNYEKMY